MRSLDQSDEQGGANRSHRGNLPQLGGDGMLATFYQQFPSHLLPQPLQEIQVLVEMFGSPADSGILDLFQPLRPMTRIVDVPSSARNRPAAIYRFQSTHHSRQLLGRRQITPCQFPQRTHTRLAMVDGLQFLEA